jgi:uncharacterized protein YndB with AHSA1/START domain
MAAKSNLAAAAEERVLVIERIFNAPRALVWRAWTDPAHLAHWWGPRGFTLPGCEVDLRVGGAYRFHMRGPDGEDHWSHGVFREIVEPERLVYAGCWVDAEGNPKGPQTLVTVTFEDLDRKTKLTLRHSGFESVSACDEHRIGWNSSLDCFAEYIETVR